jgi:hypothetical protein
MNAIQMRWVGAVSAILMAFALPVFGQAFEISSISAADGAVQVRFPGRSDSYYFLHSRTSLSAESTATAALLGAEATLVFQAAVGRTNAMFFQVEQLPLTNTTSTANDGVPDGWKLQHGLDPLGPSQANQIATGYVMTWLQLYEWDTEQAAMPLAYFPTASSTVLVGSSNATVQVAFSRPYSGYLTYQLSGTAIPKSAGVTGDYISPPGRVYVANSTLAAISISLVPEPDIEINRSIVIALSAPPLTNQTYTITTNSCVATVQIVQSTQGVFVGTLTLTNGLFTSAQPVKMALRPGTGGSTVAVLDVTGNSLLGNMFSVPASVGASGFQLNGGQFSNLLTNTPWGRNLSVNLSFGSTQTNGAVFITPVTIDLSGLTASGVLYSGSGILNLAKSQ